MQGYPRGRVLVKSSDKTWSTGGGSGNAPQYSFHENPINRMKWQNDMISHWKISPPGWKVPNILHGKNRGQLPIALERIKWLGQSENNPQLWMHLAVKVKSNAVKTNNVSEPE